MPAIHAVNEDASLKARPKPHHPRIAPARDSLKPKPLRGGPSGPGLTLSRSGATGLAW